MITSPATAKVFQGVASRQQMFRMFDRHAQRPNRWDGDAAPFYAGEWFEIGETEYDYMFEVLPPLWVRGSMFAMREYMTGSVTSVFFALRIDAAIRYFQAIAIFPTRHPSKRCASPSSSAKAVRSMTRQERLEHIWSTTADDYRGYAGDKWPQSARGKRTVVLYGGNEGTFLKLLEELTDGRAL